MSRHLCAASGLQEYSSSATMIRFTPPFRRLSGHSAGHARVGHAATIPSFRHSAAPRHASAMCDGGDFRALTMGFIFGVLLALRRRFSPMIDYRAFRFYDSPVPQAAEAGPGAAYRLTPSAYSHAAIAALCAYEYQGQTGPFKCPAERKKRAMTFSYWRARARPMRPAYFSGRSQYFHSQRACEAAVKNCCLRQAAAKISNPYHAITGTFAAVVL